MQVRGADYLAVGITITLAALSVADVLYMNLRERAPEFASLRTVGWSDRHLIVVVALEAVMVSATGSLIGVAVGVGISMLVLNIPISPLAVAAGFGLAGAPLPQPTRASTAARPASARLMTTSSSCRPGRR